MQKIPKELITSIFAYLSVKDLLTVTQVCKKWQELAEHNCLWRPLVENHNGEENCKQAYKSAPLNRKPKQLFTTDIFYLVGAAINLYEDCPVFVPTESTRLGHSHSFYSYNTQSIKRYNNQNRYMKIKKNTFTQNELINSFWRLPILVRLYISKDDAYSYANSISSEFYSSPIFQVRARFSCMFERSASNFIEVSKKILVIKSAELLQFKLKIGSGLQQENVEEDMQLCCGLI